MRMKSVFIIAFLFVTTIAFSKGEINYEHKSIDKTLVKTCKLVNPVLHEVSIPHTLENASTLQGKFFTIKSDNTDSNLSHLYIGRVNSCRAGGCSRPGATPFGESEYFDYMAFYNGAGEVILIKVFNYQASHGYEVTAKGWLKQFIGYSSEQNLEVGDNIDSISGATISVNGITADIKQKTALLKTIIGQS